MHILLFNFILGHFLSLFWSIKFYLPIKKKKTMYHHFLNLIEPRYSNNVKCCTNLIVPSIWKAMLYKNWINIFILCCKCSSIYCERSNSSILLLAHTRCCHPPLKIWEHLDTWLYYTCYLGSLERLNLTGNTWASHPAHASMLRGIEHNGRPILILPSSSASDAPYDDDP